MQHKLFRSQKNRILLGVCGGLGEYLKIDPVIVRIIALLLLIPGVFPAVIAYFVLALVVPLEGSTASSPRDSFKENISDMRDTTSSLGEEVRSGFENKENTPQSPGVSDRGTTTPRSLSNPNQILIILGIIIIAVGLFLILVNVFDWFWRYAWPVLLIIAGAIVIILVTRRKR